MQTQKVRVEFNHGRGGYTISKDYEPDIKINARFDIEVPVEHDETGRRVNVLSQVMPLIEGFSHDVKMVMACRRANSAYKPSSGPSEEEVNLYERMTSEKVTNELKWRAKFDKLSAEKWALEKNLETVQLFGMSWQDFRSLSWDEQASLRKEKGVIWDGRKWVKQTVPN